MPTVLVAGSSGLIGRHVVDAFGASPGWRVVTTCRGHAAAEMTGAVEHHVRVDLRDAGSAEALVQARPDVTHLVFAASARAAGAEGNMALVANLLDAFRGSHSVLHHVTFFQGGTVYGSSLGPYKIPAKESDPRLPVPDVSDDQVGLIVDAAAADGFRWTVLRPDTVIGHPGGTARNLLMVLAVYASVCRARGLPLRFPGTEAQYRSLVQVTDAELLGRAAVWAASSEAAVDDVFNVTNGDAFRWCDLWGRIGEAFGVPIAPPAAFSLVDAMSGNGDVWDWLVSQYDLVPMAWDEVADWEFGDRVLHTGFDQLFSTVKVRRAGFGEACDSEERMIEWFQRLADRRVIPPLGA